MKTSKAKIMIVEDESVLAENLQMKLETLGYEVTGVADHAEQAISMARENRPEVILMDVRLNGEMDGIQASQILQEESRIPVVYLTGHADEETYNRMQETHPDGCLLKPCDPEALQMVLELALIKGRESRRLSES